MTFKIEFLDTGRKPKCAPNPAYPDGMSVDLSNGASKTCTAALFQVTTCGRMLLVCDTCGIRVMISVAGRADDARTVKVACRGN